MTSHVDLKNLARKLRRNQTKAETLIWSFLRGSQLGCKFRRQQEIGGRYIVDFVCLQEKLVIELDGGQHHEAVDSQRTAFLHQEGFHVLRFWNNDVLQNTEGVLEHIRSAIQNRLK